MTFYGFSPTKPALALHSNEHGRSRVLLRKVWNIKSNMNNFISVNNVNDNRVCDSSNFTHFKKLKAINTNYAKGH